MPRARHKSDNDEPIIEIAQRIMKRAAWCQYEWEVEQLVKRLDARYDKVTWMLRTLVKQGKVRKIKTGGQVPDVYVWIQG